MALSLASPTQAAFVSAAPLQPEIQLVRDGCGPNGHRAPPGFCVPNGHYRGYDYRNYRGCPRGSHPTRYGCRRNF